MIDTATKVLHATMQSELSILHAADSSLKIVSYSVNVGFASIKKTREMSVTVARVPSKIKMKICKVVKNTDGGNIKESAAKLSAIGRLEYVPDK